MNEYLTALWASLDGKLIILALLTVIDFLFGIVMSFVKKEFKWEYLMHYLNSDVLPIFGWVGIVLVTSIPGQFVPEGALLIGTDVVYGTVFLGILASILGSIAEMGVLTKPLNKIGIG
ncbi:hypothetical protein MUP59_09595 [Candidatus Bathyarchaeota archaeon]|nr:hypothetical protein [Candidatus Bathyarchaeota archaeon]